MKKILTLGLAAGVIAGGVAAGGALAHTPGDGDKPLQHRGGKRLEIASETLGISTEELKSQLEDATFEEILSDYGYDSKEAFFDATIPVLESKLAERGLSDEEIAERIEKITAHMAIKQDVAEAHAKVLGLTRDEVRTQLEDGETFEEIIAEQGFDSPKALHQAVSDDLASAWANEGVGQDEIDERLEKFDNRFEHRKQRHQKLKELAEELGVEVSELRKALRKFGPHGPRHGGFRR